MGGTEFKWGPGTTGPPAGDGHVRRPVPNKESRNNSGWRNSGTDSPLD